MKKQPISQRRYLSGARRTVAAFNEVVAVGTPVRFWSVLPKRAGDEGLETATRSKAWVLDSGEPVVMLAGKPGCVALSHVEVLA